MSYSSCATLNLRLDSNPVNTVTCKRDDLLGGGSAGLSIAPSWSLSSLSRVIAPDLISDPQPQRLDPLCFLTEKPAEHRVKANITWSFHFSGNEVLAPWNCSWMGMIYFARRDGNGDSGLSTNAGALASGYPTMGTSMQWGRSCACGHPASQFTMALTP